MDLDFLKIDSLKLGLNRRAFVEDILNVDFEGNINDCAKKMGFSTKYLNELIRMPEKEAGCKTLTRIWRYAKKTGRDPEKYILKTEMRN